MKKYDDNEKKVKKNEEVVKNFKKDNKIGNFFI
jgi:hypothetical protein